MEIILPCSADHVMMIIHTDNLKPKLPQMCHKMKEGQLYMKDMTKLNVTPWIVFSVEANLIILIPLHENRT